MAKKSKVVKVSSSESEAGTPRLQELYSNTVRPALAEELSRKNPHSIPRLEKIVVNMGVGTAVTEKKTSRRSNGCARSDRGPKACCNVVSKGCFWIQAARRSADRL